MTAAARSNDILLVDDDEPALRTLARGLAGSLPGFTFHNAHAAEAALEIATEIRPQAAVVDLTLDPRRGPESGLQLMSDLQTADPTIRVLVLTGHGSEDYGIKAMHHGAASFLQKPANIDYLAVLLQDAVNYSRFKRRYQELTRQSTRQLLGLSTASARMAEVLSTAAFAAATSQSVLLVGETGTGKGVLAQAIHAADAKAASRPFIRFQPSYTTSDLVASELFGHTKGSFTGATEDRRGLIESADGGTLFIDEVDELPENTQVMLLHVLQERSFRKIGARKETTSKFRLITASNRPLAELREGKKLRRDFYHRIAHLCIEIPPLRERMEDLAELAHQFARGLSNREKLQVQGLTAQAVNRLERYHWPGNVRELQAVVEGGVYRASFRKRQFIEPEDLQLAAAGDRRDSSILPLKERIAALELQMAREALHRFQNNHTHAAESLGIDRGTLRRILKRGKPQ